MGLFLVGTSAECNFHVTFEGVCFCRLKIPTLVRVYYVYKAYIKEIVFV